MAATLETLDELKTWDGYRQFMKERLKQAPTEGCSFYVSKVKVDFDLDGKPWKGYAVLAGPKGELAVKKMKKQGLLFREGISRLNGKEFTVEGIEPSYLKQADLTLKKLKLGYSIAGVEAGEGEEEAGDEAGPVDTAAELDERKKDVIQSIKEAAALGEPANRAVLTQAATKIKEVEAALAKNDPTAAEKGLDEIEDLLTEVVEGPEPADGDDPELAGLGDWDAYRAFTKAQLKRMPKEGGSFFVTRKKVEFTIEGKPYKNYAVLLGKESKVRPTVQELKKEGTPCFEGTCVPEGKTIKVHGIKPELVKGVVKLFMKLRLGWKIVLGQAPADEGAGGRDVLQTIRTEAQAWQAASASVDQQITALRAALKAAGDPELAQIADVGLPDMKNTPQRPLTDALKALITADGSGRGAAIAGARKAVSDFSAYIEGDPRIAACDQNPLGIAVSIRATLAPALEKLDRGLASIANEG